MWVTSAEGVVKNTWKKKGEIGWPRHSGDEISAKS